MRRFKASLLLTAVTIVTLAVQSSTVALNGRASRTQGPCPTVNVSGPDNVNEGTSFFFTANVSGGEKSGTPKFNWTLSNGQIKKGQGTSTIEVDTDGLGQLTTTATVEVTGFGADCRLTSSASAYVVKRPQARKIDEYGELRASDANPRLDNFAIELESDPGTQAYIIGYGGRHSRPGAGQVTANAAKAYLVKERGIDPKRIVASDGGYQEEVNTELWIVPSGATPPAASPTVDPSEVKPATPTRKPRAAGPTKP